MFARLPRSDQLTLTQGNVYILPSRAGWAMLATLIVLLIAAINYQLNLGYLLTFLLAGSAAASMVVGHGNLRGLQLSLGGAGSQGSTSGGCFAHAPCPMHISLHNARRSRRWGIGLALHKTRHNTDHSDAWTWVDIPEQGSTAVQLSFMPTRRGQQELPAISILTRYPLGAFRVWALWRPQTLVWVYPAPETHAPPLPAASPEAGGRSSAQVRSGEEFDGVRSLSEWRPAQAGGVEESGPVLCRRQPPAGQPRPAHGPPSPALARCAPYRPGRP
jgi:uncharacterized protein (DUF58 family)